MSLKIFYDGQCRICSAEMEVLKLSSQDRTIYQDLHDPNCDAYRLGLSKEQLMREMHAELDGRILRGVAVFREAYARAGKGRLLAWTGWPLLRPIADFAYGVFARNRLWISRVFGGVVERYFQRRFPMLTRCGTESCKISEIER